MVRPREFACVLGPSGAGKSTLLGILSGRVMPDRGVVTLNQIDLHAHFVSLKRDIAVVPQRSVLHESLAVADSLRYTAELRLPSDMLRDDLDRAIEKILQMVGLGEHQEKLIKTLSGGQLKRAALANELISSPSLLLIDEAASGLDELTDREMMELFRRVADSGKTVVCITHNISNVEHVANLVVLLAEGGCLAFVGAPAEAKIFFDVARLGDIYRKMAFFPAEQWESAFWTSPLFERHVASRLPAGALMTTADEAVKPDEDPVVAPFVTQTSILVRRAIALWRADPFALGSMLGQSLILAILMGLVFGRISEIENDLERARQTINLLFLLNI